MGRSDQSKMDRLHALADQVRAWPPYLRVTSSAQKESEREKLERDEYGRLPCVHCGAAQYPDSPFCLACGKDEPT
jgi:uncharacterized OB-fold protein